MFQNKIIKKNNKKKKKKKKINLLCNKKKMENKQHIIIFIIQKFYVIFTYSYVHKINAIKLPAYLLYLYNIHNIVI